MHHLITRLLFLSICFEPLFSFTVCTSPTSSFLTASSRKRTHHRYSAEAGTTLLHANLRENHRPLVTTNMVERMHHLLGQTTSILVAGSVFLAIAYFRDATTMSLFIGSVSNGILSKVLKRVLNQSRPAPAATATTTTTTKDVAPQPADKGMPSSHAMSLGFIGIFTACQLPWSLIPIILYSFLSLLYRVRVNLHSADQVVVGALLGGLNGCIWWHWTVGQWNVAGMPGNLSEWINRQFLVDGVLPYPMLFIPLLVGGLTVGSIERRLKGLLSYMQRVQEAKSE